jgi:hypothetical protein
VTLFADGGERYLSTFYDDEWLASRLGAPRAQTPLVAR